MTHVTSRLTAKNRNKLRNPTLGNRVRYGIAFYSSACSSVIPVQSFTSPTHAVPARPFLVPGKISFRSYGVRYAGANNVVYIREIYHTHIHGARCKERSTWGGALARRGDGAETRMRLRSQGGRYHESSAARRCFITTARGGMSSGGRDPEVERFRHKETAAQERRNKVVADDSRPRSPCILSELCHSVCSGPAGREGAGNSTGDSCRWRRGCETVSRPQTSTSFLDGGRCGDDGGGGTDISPPGHLSPSPITITACSQHLI